MDTPDIRLVLEELPEPDADLMIISDPRDRVLRRLEEGWELALQQFFAEEERTQAA